MSTLDPDAAAVLADLGHITREPSPDAPAAVRRDQFRLTMSCPRNGDPEPHTVLVTDEIVTAFGSCVPIRRYTPPHWRAGDPVTVWIHGGGWVLGNLDSAAPSASALAATTGAQIVSVDYRLAPEHPYPAALNDCLAVLQYEAMRAAQSDVPHPARIGVGGDSAGGNLAAAMALAAPDLGITISAALLIYPALDASMRTASYRDFADGHLLTADAMAYYWDSYVGPTNSAERDSPLVQPVLAEDVSCFPPTVVTTAALDPLRDEGEAFAEQLSVSGVAVTHLRADRLTHGWLDMTDRVPAAHDERARTFTAFSELLCSAHIG